MRGVTSSSATPAAGSSTRACATSSRPGNGSGAGTRCARSSPTPRTPPPVTRRWCAAPARCTRRSRRASGGSHEPRRADRGARHLPRLWVRLRRHHRRREAGSGRRQRADVIVCWGVDPVARYPRFATRYAVEPRGLEAPRGRGSRTVIAVDVGAGRGPADADARVEIAGGDEVDALGVMRATVQGRVASDEARFRGSAELAGRMSQGRYVALVADGEPGAAPADPDRAEALVTLAQALNAPTRCALIVLRGGGNRSGADAVLTWQTGFPFAVDFAPGFPTYRPHAGAAALLAAREIDAALVIGSPASIPAPLIGGLAGLPTVAIGPRASAAAFKPAVSVHTGIAGIHEGGTAYRMDEVPLPLRPALAGPPTAAGTLRALRERLGA